MTNLTITGQVLSILALGLTVLSFQCRSNRKFFLVQEAAGLFYTISFILLGAWSGAFMNIYGVIRPEVLRREKIASSKWTLAGLLFLLLLCALSAVFLFKEVWYLALISGIAQIAGTICMWSQNGKWIRLGQLFFVSPLWLTYNFMLPIPSIGGVIAEIINVISGLIALFRYRKNGFTK